MKSLNTIQSLSKLGKVLSKIAFILAVVGFCGCIAGLLSLSFGNGGLLKLGYTSRRRFSAGWSSAPGKRCWRSLPKFISATS